MITYFCSPDHSVKNIFELVYKLYKHDRSILLIVKNEEDMNMLNDAFWKSRRFLPHGDENDPNLQDQTIVISTKKIENMKFDTYIYFHHASDSYESVENILWNPPRSEAKGKIWQEENGKWSLGKI
ncbi:hypothetical protein FZC35_00355 [Candidatus Cytomitobacter indipagum]|uniref:DNA polymerase III subunit chi n=1 Tax=Candidatus Cytomitobacter indipagum TaxID=2601575 RepID=A0A5C0UDM0_9PROT|nr:DNA polymerase III subunit chi [Candidatus Cytomitobacter indipagum]QEK37841.1 hypothetical protein FZC35_00355 [Candidatus Cytomitobacter indipagum]